MRKPTRALVLLAILSMVPVAAGCGGSGGAAKDELNEGRQQGEARAKRSQRI